MKIPGPDHPITIEPFAGDVTISFGDKIVAQSGQALALNESTYPAVYYLPRTDVEMAYFDETDRVTHCPYKGDATHFTIRADREVAENAAWSYQSPYPPVSDIAGHIVFYADKVTVAVRQT